VIRIQVSIIYLHAAIGKIAVTEWVDGTALYYWFTHPVFGVADSVRPWILPLLSHGAAVMAMTWGVIALELALFLGLVAERRYRTTLLVFGLAFHFGIFVVHGLFTFFVAMAAALILYLRPLDQPFQIPQRYGWLPSQWRLAASRP
jgi:antimicrobial peptide system SdpB family protein